MISIKRFCKKHGACIDGIEWALKNCKDMNEVWETAKPKWLIWVATRKGVLTDKELWLFAIWCARNVKQFMTDGRCIKIIEVSEMYVNVAETDEELSAVWESVWGAWRCFLRNNMPSSACESAWNAANGAVSESANAACGDADKGAARLSARRNQADYLRKNCKPRF